MSEQERPEQQPGSDQSRESSGVRQQSAPPRGGMNAGSGSGGGGGRHRERQRHRESPAQPHRPGPAINMDELRELIDLIAAQGFTEFELEREGFRVRLRRDAAPSTPAPSATPPQFAPAHRSATPSAPPATVPPATNANTETPAPATSPTPVAAATAPASVPVKEEDLQIITSPIVGTFYRASSPTSEAFVRPGSHVEPDTVVCIIEAMKLMNEIQAETTGIVEKIFVENGQPVEFGQPLFGIKK